MDDGEQKNNSEVSTQEQSFNRWLRGLETFFPEQKELPASNSGDAALSGGGGRRADRKDHVTK